MNTKTILAITTIFSLLLANLWSQEKNQTIRPSNDNSISTLADSASVKIGGYGGPEIRATSFAGKWGVLGGIRGGLLINRKFTIGLIGAGLAYDVERNHSSGETIKIEMGYGGTYFEYIWELSKAFHFSVPIDLVAMGVNIQRKESSTILDFMFGLIPRFNLEFNISSFFIISLTGGYRFIFGENNDYMDVYDAWGPEIGLLFKFGKF